MTPLRRPPLRPNWWTILPLLASAAMWAGIIYVGAWTQSMLDGRAAPLIQVAASDETGAFSRKQPGRTDCPQPGCAAQPAPGAPATPTR